ncbi:MAG: hypothetical protein ACU843_01005 [Gammaproteobacteria bacterium]
MFIRVILITIALSFSACATRKPEMPGAAHPPEEETESAVTSSSRVKPPPQTTFKNERELKLVRVMEGGACNTENQGARGLFLVYAEPDDIERIKKEKGTSVFERFEHEIEDLSLQAWQESVNSVSISDNPFALDVEDALDQVVRRLIEKFKEFARSLIGQFESDSGMTIDVIPFSPSMSFILENCDENLHETPTSE